MFGTLGGPEVILILVVALIVFGPRRLPEIGKSMGKMLAEFRKASNDFKRTIDDELEAEKTRESQAQLPPAAPAEPPASTTSAPAVAEPEAAWRPPYEPPPATSAYEPPPWKDEAAEPPAAPAAPADSAPGVDQAPASPVEAPVETVSRTRSDE